MRNNGLSMMNGARIKYLKSTIAILSVVKNQQGFSTSIEKIIGFTLIIGKKKKKKQIVMSDE